VSGYSALVTGSSRGIGKGIALALAAEGFSIAVNAPAADGEVGQTVAELRSMGIKTHAAIADIADLSAHEAMLAGVEEALGPLTTLVNNAGVSVRQRGDLLDVTPESYDRCQAVNTRGGFFLAQAWARRALNRERPGNLHHCIITVSSSNASAVSIARGEYCVSKAGASMTARLFAVRLGAHDIGSYEIQPGLIETAMTEPVKDIYLQRISEGLTVAKRMGTPADIGAIALALATGKLAFCTGQALQADGGLAIPRF
jgi:3-oxoacyl-[acyl-carrier protein] reductase